MKIGGIIMIDRLNVKGKVTIKLINKDTGKVDYEETIHNVMLKNGAYQLMYAITGKQSITALTRVGVYKSDKTLIFADNGVWGDIIDTGTSLQCTLTYTDSTDASYTFRYLTITHPTSILYENSCFANDRGSEITKASNQILTIQWTISIPYSSPP
jgi:hypothetical protein